MEDKSNLIKCDINKFEDTNYYSSLLTTLISLSIFFVFFCFVFSGFYSLHLIIISNSLLGIVFTLVHWVNIRKPYISIIFDDSKNEITWINGEKYSYCNIRGIEIHKYDSYDQYHVLPFLKFIDIFKPKNDKLVRLHKTSLILSDLSNQRNLKSIFSRRFKVSTKIQTYLPVCFRLFVMILTFLLCNQYQVYLFSKLYKENIPQHVVHKYDKRIPFNYISLSEGNFTFCIPKKVTKEKLGDESVYFKTTDTQESLYISTQIFKGLMSDIERDIFGFLIGVFDSKNNYAFFRKAFYVKHGMTPMFIKSLLLEEVNDCKTILDIEHQYIHGFVLKGSGKDRNITSIFAFSKKSNCYIKIRITSTKDIEEKMVDTIISSLRPKGNHCENK